MVISVLQNREFHLVIIIRYAPCPSQDKSWKEYAAAYYSVVTLAWHMQRANSYYTILYCRVTMLLACRAK